MTPLFSPELNYVINNSNQFIRMVLQRVGIEMQMQEGRGKALSGKSAQSYGF